MTGWMWNLLFFALTAALLVLPFYPAWREWRYPADAQPLPLDGPQGNIQAVPTELTLGTVTQPVAQASQIIQVPVGASFIQLVAPTIALGSSPVASAPVAQADTLHTGKPSALMSLLHAKTWGKNGWRVKGRCQVPNTHHLTGSLVVLGALDIGSNCVMTGDIKAHGKVTIGPHSLVTGSVFSPREIVLAPGAQVHGAVFSEDRIHLSTGCVVGLLHQPVTVCAPRIHAASGARVHGTLWARQGGQVA